MEMVCSIRRFNGGKWLVSYLDHDGHQVAIVPVNFWRRGKPRREIGGAVPRGFEPGVELVAELAARRRNEEPRYRVYLDTGGDPCTVEGADLPGLFTELDNHVMRVERI